MWRKRRFEDFGYQDNTRVFLLVAAVGVNSLAQAFPHNEVVAFQAGRQEEGVPDDDDDGNMLLMKIRMIMVVIVLQTHSQEDSACPCLKMNEHFLH